MIFVSFLSTGRQVDNDFKKIGYETAIGKRRWAGPVIATPQALYCVLAVCNSSSDLLRFGFAGALGGAIGGLIAGAMSKTSASSPPTMAKIGDVPEQLRAPDTGPLRKFKVDVPVLVIPKQSTGVILKGSWINNTLKLMLGDELVVISHKPFGASSVREYLAGAGWPLNWRGEQINRGMPI